MPMVGLCASMIPTFNPSMLFSMLIRVTTPTNPISRAASTTPPSGLTVTEIDLPRNEV